MYQPSQKILENYANVLVNFALGGGKGIKKGETVYLIIPEIAKPLLSPLERAIYKKGGNVILRYTPDNTNRFGIGRDFFELASKQQLNYFPEKYVRGLVDEIDHVMVILGNTNPKILQGIDSKKIQQQGLAYKPYMDWRNEKEHAGNMTWTLALYGTAAMAEEAKLSEKEYWDQIIKACFLDAQNPIAEWKKASRIIETTRAKLNKLPIEKINILGPDADLWITIGEKRQWLGGSGRNIPSFEVFTSPDWRGTEGWIKFNQPLYYSGNLIEGIELTFKKGKVVKATAKKNEQVLKNMIASHNADKVGEFSLTDKRTSRITKFMANTLFDENIGGEHGNTHIAVGMSYVDTYAGDVKKLTKAQTEKLGYNDSAVHTDIISTSPRTVTAYLKNGTEKVIYKNGEFII
ncbi:MAG: aminopeptidase [Candidatus Paceibacter sp.]|jgi:aminopeptidase|nr:aminopeptidase [Candidatus Paceibacter sp.]